MKKFAFLLLILLPFAAQADEKSAYEQVIAKNEIVCGVIPWAPYKELDPNTKEWKGFSIDLYRAAFSTLDIKVTFKEVVLGNQVQDLNSGRVDAICDDGPWTMSAAKFVEYSEPLYYAIVYPYARKSDTHLKTRNDLNNAGVTFTGVDGDLSSDLQRRLFPKAKLSSMPATAEASQLLLNVMTKKADVAITDPAVFAAFSKSNPDNGLVPLFKDTPLGKYRTVVSVRKGDLKMLGLVNQAVDNALDFGIVDQVLDAYDPQHDKLMRVRNRAAFQ